MQGFVQRQKNRIFFELQTLRDKTLKVFFCRIIANYEENPFPYIMFAEEGEDLI